jgi:hypothetical protein
MHPDQSFLLPQRVIACVELSNVDINDPIFGSAISSWCWEPGAKCLPKRRLEPWCRGRRPVPCSWFGPRPRGILLDGRCRGKPPAVTAAIRPWLLEGDARGTFCKRSRGMANGWEGWRWHPALAHCRCCQWPRTRHMYVPSFRSHM